MKGEKTTFCAVFERVLGILFIMKDGFADSQGENLGKIKGNQEKIQERGSTSSKEREERITKAGILIRVLAMLRLQEWEALVGSIGLDVLGEMQAQCHMVKGPS